MGTIRGPDTVSGTPRCPLKKALILQARYFIKYLSTGWQKLFHVLPYAMQHLKNCILSWRDALHILFETIPHLLFYTILVCLHRLFFHISGVICNLSILFN